MEKMKFRDLVKPLEFTGVVATTGLGFFFGGVSLFWGVVIVGTYVALNLLGLATKPTQDVIDEIKDEIEEKKEDKN